MMSISAAGNGGSFKPLQRRIDPQQIDKQFKEVAELYEKQFLREMVKQMRGTISEGGFIPTNQAEKIFREKLDHEYVEKWGDSGGIGLSKMIYEQLIEKYGPALGLKSPWQKPEGPLPLDEKSQFRGYVKKDHVGPKSSQGPSLEFEFSRQLGTKALTEVRSPWDGLLTGAKRFGEGFAMVDIQHPSGVSSQLIFRGEPSAYSQGAELKAGQVVGVLSPEGQTLTWKTILGPKSGLE
jgi:flagellar protein FlgJ